MSRYGFYTGRENLSPYSSMSGGAPAVTDEDFSYITSQDLEEPVAGSADGRHSSRSHSLASAPENDVLLIKHKGVIYPTNFPAYAIGDGKLRVRDVRERVGLMMDLNDRSTRRVKLYYKGRHLKEPAAPVRNYGVKNKSELMATLADGSIGSSGSEEEMVIVDEASRRKSKRGSSGAKKKKKRQKSGKTNEDSVSSPSSTMDSASNIDTAKSPSPAVSNSPTGGASTNTGPPSPMKKLDDINSEFSTKWLPLCVQYTTSPPADAKKREDEHRMLTESIMQHVIFKLDEVDTGGVAEVRTRRKELVTKVQEVLKNLDSAKNS